MSSSWQRLKVGDFLTLEYGKPLDKAKRKEDGLYPAYGANGIKCWSDEFYYDKPTIIVGRKGSAGEITLTKEKFWPLDVTYFVTFDDNKYDLMFIYHLLSLLDLQSLATGVKPGINRNNVYAIEAYVPELHEQKRAVAILDQAFADIDKARALTEQNIKNAHELFESYLQQMFSQRGEGWVEKRFSECFKLRSGEGLTKKDMIDGPFPVYGGNGVAGNHNDYNLSEDSVIIGRVGALCGNARFICKKIWLTDNAFLVKDYKFEFDLEFLTYLLNYKKLRNLARQAAQPVISNSSLSELILEFPLNLQKQSEIKDTLDQLQDELKSVSAMYQKKIECLDDLKKSLLHKAFSGELTKDNQEAA